MLEDARSSWLGHPARSVNYHITTWITSARSCRSQQHTPVSPHLRWFVFDFILVLNMVIETWILPLVHLDCIFSTTSMITAVSRHLNTTRDVRCSVSKPRQCICLIRMLLPPVEMSCFEFLSLRLGLMSGDGTANTIDVSMLRTPKAQRQGHRGEPPGFRNNG